MPAGARRAGIQGVIGDDDALRRRNAERYEAKVAQRGYPPMWHPEPPPEPEPDAPRRPMAYETPVATRAYEATSRAHHRLASHTATRADLDSVEAAKGDVERRIAALTARKQRRDRDRLWDAL